MHPNIIFLYPFIPYKTLSYFLMSVIINCIWIRALAFKLNVRDEAWWGLLLVQYIYNITYEILLWVYDMSMVSTYLWYLRICYHISMDHYVNYNSHYGPYRNHWQEFPEFADAWLCTWGDARNERALASKSVLSSGLVVADAWSELVMVNLNLRQVVRVTKP